MTNAASTRSIERARKAQAEDHRDEALVIGNLMSTPIGRRWAFLQLQFCRCTQSVFSPDHATMSFNEGQRNFGLKFLDSILRHAPEMYIHMLRENSSGKLIEEEPSDD